MIICPILDAQFSKPYFETNEIYTISISEKPFFDDSEGQVFKIDSFDNKIKKLEIRQYSIQNLLDTLYQNDHFYVDDVLINLDYSSKISTTKEELFKILSKKYKIHAVPH